MVFWQNEILLYLPVCLVPRKLRLTPPRPGHTKLPELYGGCLKGKWVLSTALAAAGTCFHSRTLQPVTKTQMTVQGPVSYQQVENTRWLKSPVLLDRGRTLHQLQYAQVGLQMYVKEGQNIHNEPPTAQPDICITRQHGASGADLQNGVICAEDPTPALHMKSSLCFRLAPAWSPELISWLLGRHMSRYVSFLLESVQNPFHVLCNATTTHNVQLQTTGRLHSKAPSRPAKVLMKECIVLTLLLRPSRIKIDSD